jgi:hypothetical protein
MNDADATLDTIAAATGAARTLVGRWTDHRDAATVQLADVPALPPAVAGALLRWAADAIGWDVSPRLSAVRGAFSLETLRRSLREAHEFHDAFAGACEDGVISDDELRAIDREGTQAIELALAICNAAKDELRRRRAA